MTLPRVTIAIPLYKAARFVERICDNISRLDYPNLEIIVSDRHSADNAIQQIQARFPNHPALRFVQEADEINWVAHYNLLLRIAGGDYFMWMSQDDWYPNNYVSDLVSELARNDAAVVAFCRIQIIHVANQSTDPALFQEGLMPDPPMVAAEPPSAKLALRLYLYWHNWVPFHGLFRREKVLQLLPQLPVAYQTMSADSYWLFGLTLRAKLHYAPAVSWHKYVYDDSTSIELFSRTKWHDVVPRRLDEFRILTRYLLQARLALLPTLYSIGILWAFAIYKIGRIFRAVLYDAFPLLGRLLPRSSRLQQHLKQQLQKFLT